jgi:hypothetical protein
MSQRASAPAVGVSRPTRRAPLMTLDAGTGEDVSIGTLTVKIGITQPQQPTPSATTESASDT